MTHIASIFRGGCRPTLGAWSTCEWSRLQRTLVLATALVATTVAYGSVAAARQTDDNQTVTALKPSLPENLATLNEQYAQVKQVIRASQVSVAHIEARKPRTTASREGTSTRNAFVEEAGSGVFLRHRGKDLVLTNFHVVDGADLQDITLIIDDHLLRPIEIRNDRETDLSILLLAPQKELTPARLGDSDGVEMGEFVLALGSPFGLSQSVSQGILSAKHRRDLELGPRGVKYQDFFQTDAAINPGNSGGPLVNLDGEVIAINTAIASNSGGSDGIGFSIPINMAMRVATDLLDYGVVRRGHLGVTLDAGFSPQVAAARGWTFAHGALVAEVVAGSPAEQARLAVGDVILEIDGKRVGNDSHLVTLVSLSPIGTKVPLLVYRDGKRITIEVSIQERPGSVPAKQ